MAHPNDAQPSRPPPPAPSGGKQVIGDFTVIKTLGSGSFGKVKLAVHTTGYKVAMKFISKRKIATPETQARVHREIQYLTLLQHPHIIKLYDVTQTTESIVMVLEYLDTELFDYIVKTGKMAEDKARRFFQQIIAAVEYCHSNDIVHRDLKPENLLLDSDLNVKIADFGLSNVMRDGDFLKTSCGSPNYAAPEVITGKLYAGPEIDIWSCGVILYVLLCGRLPFDDEHIPALFKKIGNGQYNMPPYLSSGARHIISRMLTVDSNSRAKLSEIRASPWFQQDLPAYLSVPARRRHSHDESAEDDSDEESVPNADVPPPEGTEWIDDFGWVERSIVEELAKRIPGMNPDQIMGDLREGNDRKLRMAYKLCRDNHKPEHLKFDVNGNPLPSAASQKSSAPARTASVRKPKPKPVDPDESVPPPSHIRILPSSLPPKDEPAPNAAFSKASRSTASPLKPGAPVTALTPQPPTPSTPASSSKAHNWTPRKRQKWHFGIRSKSAPMEVMAEIYRALTNIGFEWKLKDSNWEQVLDPQQPQSSDSRKNRKDEEERTKKMLDLFFIECRGVVDNTLIRFDLQLYSQGDESFLVDFRMIGYKRQRPDPAAATPAMAAEEAVTAEEGEARARAESTSTVADNERERIRQVVYQKAAFSGLVSSPMLFFEVAASLIIELAIPRD